VCVLKEQFLIPFFITSQIKNCSLKVGQMETGLDHTNSIILGRLRRAPKKKRASPLSKRRANRADADMNEEEEGDGEAQVASSWQLKECV
jgi:hypothetical protein